MCLVSLSEQHQLRLHPTGKQTCVDGSTHLQPEKVFEVCFKKIHCKTTGNSQGIAGFFKNRFSRFITSLVPKPDFSLL
jgi:hypothetical protein